MKHYTINLYFRRMSITASVHDHGSFLLIGFTNDEVLRDFGGLLEFDSAGNYKAGAKSQPKDATDLYRAVREAIQAR